jgi:ferritin-like metal-binding protein YciE
MATATLETKFHEYLIETHAMEKKARRQLDALIAESDDEEMEAAFRRHRAETDRQLARLQERLADHGEQPSHLRDAGAQFAAFFKVLGNLVADDKPAKHAVDAYVTEHLEIAAYQLLEQMALHAGDEQTAQVARQNRAEEEAMARTITARWDRVVRQVLAEDGLLAQSQSKRSAATAAQR